MKKNRIFLTIIVLLVVVIAVYAYAWAKCYRAIGFIPARTLSVGVVSGTIGGDSYSYNDKSFESKGPAVAACLKDRFHF